MQTFSDKFDDRGIGPSLMARSVILDPALLTPEISLEKLTESIRPVDLSQILDKLERSHPEIFEAFSKLGMHPLTPTPPLNPFLGTTSGQVFPNIGEHSLAVSGLALNMATALNHRGVLGESEVDLVTELSLVHDINKPLALMLREAGKLSGRLSEQELAGLLPGLLPDRIAAQVLQAASITGTQGIREILRIEHERVSGIVSGNLIPKIVLLADSMTATSAPSDNLPTHNTYLTTWERLVLGTLNRNPHLTQFGLAIDSAGKYTEVSSDQTEGVNFLGTYSLLNVFAANCICRELQLMLDPGSKLPPEVWAKETFGSGQLLYRRPLPSDSFFG